MGATKGTGKLRIIAGEWRGRKLPVADLPGLRPSTDRSRETLFNWLAPHTAEARCLDLFAGTGALGLEALSRGAAHCQFVEQQSRAAKLLNESLALLGANDRSDVWQGDARQFLQGSGTGKYDLVFLDPPFASDLLDIVLEELESSALLAEAALVYVECASDHSPSIPGPWEQHRSKKSGDVSYALYCVKK
ncbi:16S rRNA (guanine(966)-N(2))-methyltransferase RsmD [Congregibacter litoralis]|uniref:16S rRNA (guanine(966)-N(2))-methyltransferase RsmD n=1 Tax=Congregibacter litoralis TaxID=393662 RepID=UPI00006B1898|nr:16S rRNA (guanine(966)-N(2))-methyltransferase RsmD [Congregibacter litoralis]